MKSDSIKEPRDIPSIEILASDKTIVEGSTDLARPLVVEVIRSVVAQVKKNLRKNPISYNDLLDHIFEELERYRLKRIGKVINGAGIMVHTNLGRAPLSETLFDKIKGQVTGYGNVEFDIESGKRGKRGELAERYLAMLSGAEAGTIVNNNAAALFLILNTFANRRKVVISRGELVQIGGGFRIPDIIRRSGAKILEIGTTNITSLSDYRAALEEKPAMVLKVHQSNFAQKGFTGEVDIRNLVGLGRKNEIPVVNDLGSGVFVDTTEFIGEHEPTVQESVRDGADLTCFSGDKLLGGMQAGLIVGKAEYVTKIKRNPVFRAMRIDKTIFSAIEELLGYYLNGTWKENIKLWKLVSRKEAELYKWGQDILKQTGAGDKITVQATNGRMGGGALPEIPLPSIALAFQLDVSAQTLADTFRRAGIPIVGRIEDDLFMIDLKAIDYEDTALLVSEIKKILEKY